MQNNNNPRPGRGKREGTHRHPAAPNTKRANGGGGGGNLKKISHALSWALRHAAPQLKLTMTSDGFVPLEEILQCSHRKMSCCRQSEEAIRTVVATNDKQRFSMTEKPAAEYAAASKIPFATETIWCIRANQGHSIPGIDPHALLTKLSAEELATLPVIVHGTYADAWKAIQTSGCLSIMKRHHIHFASGLLGEEGVISGMRRSCQVYIYIDSKKCANDGIVFFRSDNGVLLTAGVDGKLPLKYVAYVTDQKGTVLLDEREENK